jgi:hypothetical protein
MPVRGGAAPPIAHREVWRRQVDNRASSVLGRDDIDAAAFLIELHLAVDERVKGEVAALAHSAASAKLVADLADNDIASVNLLATEVLDAAPLGIGIPAVATGSLTLFVCHDSTKTRVTGGEK